MCQDILLRICRSAYNHNKPRRCALFLGPNCISADPDTTQEQPYEFCRICLNLDAVIKNWDDFLGPMAQAAKRTRMTSRKPDLVAGRKSASEQVLESHEIYRVIGERFASAVGLWDGADDDEIVVPCKIRHGDGNEGGASKRRLSHSEAKGICPDSQPIWSNIVRPRSDLHREVLQ